MVGTCIALCGLIGGSSSVSVLLLDADWLSLSLELFSDSLPSDPELELSSLESPLDEELSPGKKKERK